MGKPKLSAREQARLEALARVNRALKLNSLQRDQLADSRRLLLEMREALQKPPKIDPVSEPQNEHERSPGDAPETRQETQHRPRPGDRPKLADVG